jgi:hypothetical protein
MSEKCHPYPGKNLSHFMISHYMHHWKFTTATRGAGADLQGMPDMPWHTLQT